MATPKTLRAEEYFHSTGTNWFAGRIIDAPEGGYVIGNLSTTQPSRFRGLTMPDRSHFIIDLDFIIDEMRRYLVIRDTGDVPYQPSHFEDTMACHRLATLFERNVRDVYDGMSLKEAVKKEVALNVVHEQQHLAYSSERDGFNCTRGVLKQTQEEYFCVLRTLIEAEQDYASAHLLVQIEAELLAAQGKAQSGVARQLLNDVSKHTLAERVELAMGYVDIPYLKGMKPREVAEELR